MNLDCRFRAGNGDTCIAEILADYQYRHYLFLIQTQNAHYLLYNVLNELVLTCLGYPTNYATRPLYYLHVTKSKKIT
jgi:hypothetical protein